jgi:hypothetical protein
MVLTNKEEPTLKPSSSKLGTCWGHYYGTLAYQTPYETNVLDVCGLPFMYPSNFVGISRVMSVTPSIFKLIFSRYSTIDQIWNSCKIQNHHTHLPPIDGWSTRVQHCLYSNLQYWSNVEGELGRETTLWYLVHVAYYLKLCNIIIVYCAFHYSTNKGWIGCLNITKHQHLYLVKNYINNKRYRNVYLLNSKWH